MATDTPDPQPEYLGDGLYVEFDGWQFRLWTERFPQGMHEVFLEPDVLAAFLRYAQKVKGTPHET